MEAHDEVEADAQLQLVEADRAQVRRPQVVLLQAVRAVHEALEEDAVPESEHVAYFVQRHPTQPAENQRLVPTRAQRPVSAVSSQAAKHSTSAACVGAEAERRVPFAPPRLVEARIEPRSAAPPGNRADPTAGPIGC